MRRPRPPSISAWLRDRPWEPPSIPQGVARYPTMISAQEQTLLYRLAAERYDGKGAIIDAGCFLGGSTAALAEGVGANRRRRLPRKPIHTYDLFALDEASKAGYPHLVGDIPLGGSTLPRFQELMGDRLEHVHVHAGDIREERWSGNPIQILFVDVAKTWSINDHVNREFLPSLIPGESVLIQQDYVHEWLPWIHIGIGLLGDALEYVGWMMNGSAVFVPTRPIALDEIPADLRTELPDDRKLELFDRAAGRFSGEARGILEIARAVLLADLGDRDAALRSFERTLAEYGGHDRVAGVEPGVRDWLERG